MSVVRHLIEKMIKASEQFAESDKKRKEGIEANAGRRRAERHRKTQRGVGKGGSGEHGAQERDPASTKHRSESPHSPPMKIADSKASPESPRYSLRSAERKGKTRHR